MPDTSEKKSCRDRKLAMAMLLFMARRGVEASTRPLRMSFAPGGCDALGMNEICKSGGWEPQRAVYQGRVLHAIARNLHQKGVLRRWTPRIGSQTYTYSLATELLKRLAPEKWSDLPYQLENTSTPAYEMSILLNSIYPLKVRVSGQALDCEVPK